MKFAPPNQTDAARELSSALASLRRRINIQASTARVRAGEAERVAFDVRKRAERKQNHRTRNNQIFAHGSNCEPGGYLNLDDLPICGLERHGAIYADWVARAAIIYPGGNRGALLRIIFSDPERLAWCRREGARTRWEWSKKKRDEETAAFLKRQKTTSRRWRSQPISELQQYLIALIRTRGDFPEPCLANRGEAYDWIFGKDGHPDFWAPPTSWPEFV